MKIDQLRRPRLGRHSFQCDFLQLTGAQSIPAKVQRQEVEDLEQAVVVPEGLSRLHVSESQLLGHLLLPGLEVAERSVYACNLLTSRLSAAVTTRRIARGAVAPLA